MKPTIAYYFFTPFNKLILFPSATDIIADTSATSTTTQTEKKQKIKSNMAMMYYQVQINSFCVQ